MRLTMIGVGNLMEVIWPVISRTVGGDDVADRLIGVTVDAGDVQRKREFFGFDILLDDNLAALRHNRPDIILFSPPPTVAPELIESVLRPYYDECRADGRPIPDLYAFPPVPSGSVYLDALGDDVLVANIIPNNVTAIAGSPIHDEGHYVCEFATPWPADRLAVLQALFHGQGAFVHLEPDQIIPMLGGAATITALWKLVPLITDLLTDVEPALSHNDVGEYLRGQVRPLTGFTPPVSTPVSDDLVPAAAPFLAAVARCWHGGVTAYYAETTLAASAARTLVERGLDLTLHTAQREPRDVLDELAVGAATKGGVLERAIRSAEEDLMPILRAGATGTVDDAWETLLTDQVRQTAHIVRVHGLTLAG